MHLSHRSGNARVTARRRRQLAAMPTMWCNAREMRRVANRVWNRMQERAACVRPCPLLALMTESNASLAA